MVIENINGMTLELHEPLIHTDPVYNVLIRYKKSSLGYFTSIDAAREDIARFPDKYTEERDKRDVEIDNMGDLEKFFHHFS